MFNTSLRRRSSTAALVPFLVSKSLEVAFATPLRGKKNTMAQLHICCPLYPLPVRFNDTHTNKTPESDLHTHDISIPLPNYRVETTSPRKNRFIPDGDPLGQPVPQLRVIILTPSSTTNGKTESATLSRIERFGSLAGDDNYAVMLFLLSSPTPPVAPESTSHKLSRSSTKANASSPMHAFAHLQTL